MTDRKSVLEHGEGEAALSHSEHPQQRRLPGVDLLRGIACLSVYLCHVNQYWHTGENLPWPLPQAFELGARGVDLFMVISGFCLTLPLVRPTTLLPVQLRKFTVRRATRLLPPYWAAVAIAAVFAMSPRWYHHVVAARAGFAELASHALTLQLIIPDHIGTINGSLWSVALEAHLYVVFPVIIWAFTRYGAQVVLPVLVALSVVWELIGQANPIGGLDYEMQLPARLVQFGLGVGCAILVQRAVRVSRRVVVPLLVISGVCAAAMQTYSVGVARLTMWGLALAVLVYLIADYEPKFVLRPIAAFGVFSYSFYLLHQPALLLSSSAAHTVTDNPYLLVGLASTLVLAGTMAMSYGFFRLVERPSHQIGRRISARL